MRLREAFDYLEGNTFAVVVGVASSLEHLILCFQEDRVVKSLLASTSPTIVREIQSRLADVCGWEIDKNYAHPGDFAITLYLWLLEEKSPEVAEECAKLLTEIPSLFWARRMTHRLLGTPDPYLVAPQYVMVSMRQTDLDQMTAMSKRAGYVDLARFVMDAIHTYTNIRVEMSQNPSLKLFLGTCSQDCQELVTRKAG